ncbi:protein little zipper 2 [Fagus crenata]
MFINSSSILCNPLTSSFRHPRLSKRHKLRVVRLNRRRRLLKEEKMRVVKAEMEIKNMKLYMANRSIIEENEKLRQKALLLHQENQALLFQLQNKQSHEKQKQQSLI